MSKAKSTASGKGRKLKEVKDKKTRQGRSKNTKYSKTPCNKAKKKYRGQGR
jgi:hypothetical protein